MTEVLVLGATGKTGSRVVDQLVAEGASVRAAARTPPSASTGVTPVGFDWADPASHDAALEGADAIYVVPPAFVVDHVASSTDLFAKAKAAGISRAVLLSARGVDADDAIPLRRAELALFDSGLDATVIRPTWFAQNFSEGVFAPGVADGVLAAPAGDGLEPFIDVDDIAAVAVSLLLDTSGTHNQRAYDLSGSQAYTFAEAAELLSDALGYTVAYVNVTPQEFVDGATAAGVPVDYAAMLGSLFEVIRNGWDAHLSDGVAEVLGRQPRSFAEWAADQTPTA